MAKVTTRAPIGSLHRKKIYARSSLSLDEYFEGWIKRRRATAEKQATPYRYNSWYRNHLRQPLGQKKLEDIQVRDIHQIQFDMASRGYHPNTVNYTIQILRLILNDAVREELLSRNPASSIRPLRYTGVSATQSKHRALTIEEQKLFLAAAKKSFYYEFFAFLLLTGMRHGEAATITWDDVDYQKNVLHVTKSLTFDKEGHVVVGGPKTAAGIRDIPMNHEIRKVLEMQWKKGLVSLRVERIPGKHRIFYPQKYPDHVLHNATANNALHRVQEDMESRGELLERFTLHALRDTFATRFIEQGGTPQTLKTILGHQKLAITMDLYSHVLPNTKQKEMESFNIGI